MGQFETGAARFAMHQADPILHLLVASGRWSTGWATWCGDGPAERISTVTNRRCRKCLQLARQDLEGNSVEPDEETDLDWYLEREPTRWQVGDPDVTEDDGPMCEATGPRGDTCNRRPGHPPPHAAGDGKELVAVWVDGAKIGDRWAAADGRS